MGVGAGGTVGLVPITRASAFEVTLLATAAPPTPSSPRTNPRRVPRPASARVNSSNRLPSIESAPLVAQKSRCARMFPMARLFIMLRRPGATIVYTHQKEAKMRFERPDTIDWGRSACATIHNLVHIESGHGALRDADRCKESQCQLPESTVKDSSSSLFSEMDDLLMKR